MTTLTITFPLRLIGRNAKHSINAITGFALILSIIVGTQGIITGFSEQIFGLTEQTGHSNRFTIRSKNPNRQLSNEIVDILEKSTLNIVLPIVKEMVNFSSQGMQIQTILVGTNITRIKEVFNDATIVAGRWPNATQTPIECIQGTDIQEYLIQDSVLNITTAGNLRSITIVGTVSGIAELQHAIIIHIEDYINITGDTMESLKYNEIKFRTEGAMKLEEIQELLKAIVPDYYNQIVVWNEQQASIFANELVGDILANLQFLFIVLFIIALIRLFHSITWFVTKYERTLLIMRAMGLSRERLFLVVIVLGFIVGNFGFILGVMIGYILPPLILSIMSSFLNVNFLVTEYPTVGILPLWIISIITTLLATIIPSIRISRSSPARISILIKER